MDLRKRQESEKTIVVKLRQTKEGDTYINDVKRISKPGKKFISNPINYFQLSKVTALPYYLLLKG